MRLRRETRAEGNGGVFLVAVNWLRPPSLWKRQGISEPQVWNTLSFCCVNLRVGIIPWPLKRTTSSALHVGQNTRTSSGIASVTCQRTFLTAVLRLRVITWVVIFHYSDYRLPCCYLCSRQGCREPQSWYIRPSTCRNLREGISVRPTNCRVSTVLHLGHWAKMS